VYVPVVVALKVTREVHEAPALNALHPLLICEKLVAPTVTATLEIVSDPVPVFAMVTDCGDGAEEVLQT
jgi:hypothetical protein